MLNIDRVINYDLPESGELFVHRVGRTGRIGQSGAAITLITAVDLPKMQEIERHLGRKLPRVPVPAQGAPRPPVAVQAPVAAPTPRLHLEATPPAESGVTDPAKRRRRRRRPGAAFAGDQLIPAAI